MTTRHDMLRQLYQAFNARDLDTLFAAMHPDVKWPNGWEGGHVFGREAVRDYWRRQWAEVDSTAIPTGFETEPDGRVKVSVHLRGVGKDGRLLWEDDACHLYEFGGDRIRSMEILAADRSAGDRRFVIDSA